MTLVRARAVRCGRVSVTLGCCLSLTCRAQNAGLSRLLRADDENLSILEVDFAGSMRSHRAGGVTDRTGPAAGQTDGREGWCSGGNSGRGLAGCNATRGSGSGGDAAVRQCAGCASGKREQVRWECEWVMNGARSASTVIDHADAG